MFFSMNANILQLPEGGDLEALHCQPSRNFDRSTKLDLTTEPPLLGRCCYHTYLFFVLACQHWQRHTLLRFLVCELAGANCKCVWL